MYMYTHTAPVVDRLINQRVHHAYTYKECNALNYVYSSKHIQILHVYTHSTSCRWTDQSASPPCCGRARHSASAYICAIHQIKLQHFSSVFVFFDMHVYTYIDI